MLQLQHLFRLIFRIVVGFYLITHAIHLDANTTDNAILAINNLSHFFKFALHITPLMIQLYAYIEVLIGWVVIFGGVFRISSLFYLLNCLLFSSASSQANIGIQYVLFGLLIGVKMENDPFEKKSGKI